MECAIRELVDRGYLQMTHVTATVRGVAVYDQLRAFGFKPDRQIAKEYIQRHYGRDNAPWKLLACMVFKIWDEKP